MRLVFIEQAINSLEEALKFNAPKATDKKRIEIRNKILDVAHIASTTTNRPEITLPCTFRIRPLSFD